MNYLKNSILIILLCCSGLVQSQVVKPLSNSFTVRYVGTKVLVQYRFEQKKGTAKVAVVLYRGNEKNENVKAIHQLNNLSVSSDYFFADSTLPAQGTYQYTIEVMSNDAVVLRESKTVYAYPAGVSPAIKTFDAKAKMQSNEVTLKWELTNTFLAGNITILRSRKRETGYAPIATVKNTDKTYLDIVDDANEPFFYQLQVVDLSKSESIYTPTIFVVADFVIKPEKAKNVRGTVRKNKPTIYWESTDAASRGFYIYKKNTTDNKFLQATGIIIKDSADKFSWTDSSSLLKAGQTYEYCIFAESNSYTKSEPSDTVRLTIEVEQASVTVTVPAPQDIRIIQNGDASINIVWAADNTNEDITGYAVFQKKITEREFRLLPNGIVSSEINYITINNPENGNSYIVKSKIGDKESAASRAVQWNNKEDKNFGPKHLKGEIIDSELTLSWLANDNANIKEYKLYKWTGRDYSVVQTIDKNASTVIVKNYTAGEKNQYMLTAINLKGVESEGTTAITVY
jgi:hypothetical protein